MILLSASLAITFLRMLLRPLRPIVGAFHTLAKGDFSQRINTVNNDEIGRVAKNINLLAQQLEGSASVFNLAQANVGAKNSQTAAEFIAGLVLEEEKYKATLNGKALELTAVEFQILVILVKESGRIFSRQQLMDVGYQDHRVVIDRTIDSHIRKLRKRIHEKCPENEIMHSVYGVGYKFELL
jgi:DNA-binding response OmpR family regulator